ncbi:hypothetical protein VCHC55B2_1641B, partial [Vibrio cholerae HC-55B2]
EGGGGGERSRGKSNRIMDQ